VTSGRADPFPADGEPGDGFPRGGKPRDSFPVDGEQRDGEPTPGGGEPPLRVTTLELFFDLVFAFTLTQLATLLASGFTVADVARVLLIFGLLWWMYEGYAWLTNARPPVHTRFGERQTRVMDVSFGSL
jgi:hypothetical protein